MYYKILCKKKRFKIKGNIHNSSDCPKGIISLSFLKNNIFYSKK